MVKKEEELQKCKEDLIYFIENHLNVRDADGNIVKLEFTPMQKRLLEAIVRNGFRNMRTLYYNSKGDPH